jgi:hypothetical protein
MCALEKSVDLWITAVAQKVIQLGYLVLWEKQNAGIEILFERIQRMRDTASLVVNTL